MSLCLSAESTVVAEQSSVALNSTLIGLDALCSKHPGQALSRLFCKDCSALKSEPPLAEEAGSSSSKHTTDTSSTLMAPRRSESEEPEASTIYYRDRSRRRRTGEADVTSLLWKRPHQTFFLVCNKIIMTTKTNHLQ